MENEYYYRNELENRMDEFIKEQTVEENPFGWIGNNLAKLMADAAFSVLAASTDLNEYLVNEGQLKS